MSTALPMPLEMPPRMMTAFVQMIHSICNIGNPTFMVRSLANVADNAWHHVAATFSSTNFMQLYINGIMQEERQGTIGSAPAPRNSIRLGVSWETLVGPGILPFGGLIDEVRVTPGVLAPPQFVYNQPADLSISKTDSPDPVRAGSDLTHTIQVTNHGPATAKPPSNRSQRS